MGLFKPDLYRALVLGFLLGTAAVVGIVGDGRGHSGMVPLAIAAPR